MIKWYSILLDKIYKTARVLYHILANTVHAVEFFANYQLFIIFVGVLLVVRSDIYLFWRRAFWSISGIYYSDAEKSQCVDLALRELLSNIIVSRRAFPFNHLFIFSGNVIYYANCKWNMVCSIPLLRSDVIVEILCCQEIYVLSLAEAEWKYTSSSTLIGLYTSSNIKR